MSLATSENKKHCQNPNPNTLKKIQTILHLYFLMRSNFMIHALQNSVLRPGVTTSIKVALKKQLCFSHAQFIQSIVVGPCNIFYVSVKTECSAELTSWDFFKKSHFPPDLFSIGTPVRKCIWLCFGYALKFLMLIW